MKWFVETAATALLTSSLLCSAATTSGSNKDGFTTVKGINASPMSAEDMGATSGELNAYDIAAALTAEAAKLAKYPQLQAADLKLAAWYETNAIAINAAFQKYGILTPCQSCK